MPDSNFILNLSVLYRNTMKYFDRALAPYDIGSGQLIFLILINENEGISMQEVTKLSEVDKGTTTKSIQRLIDQGYVKTVPDEKDRRIKRLYTAERAADVMRDIYEMRNTYRAKIRDGMDFEKLEELMAQVCVNTREKLDPDADYAGMRIGRFDKMSLTDYPETVSCTVYMSGCCMKCPYCSSRDLVFIPEDTSFVSPDEVLRYLEKRRKLLDAVCLSGGEPLMQKDTGRLLSEIRKMGYKVKIDTCGMFPDRMKELIDEGLVDYIAMDIKNCREKYALTAGMSEDRFSMDTIGQSVSLLMNSDIDYEFRTTVVRELHTEDDLLKIAEWIRGCRRYYLQPFKNTGNLIQNGFSSYNDQEMIRLKEAVRAVIPDVRLRDVVSG
ncbi:MAG: anaerobic ribonucleoside-triphosphate reductase activating protein [Solobacterium sp.]|nr:anaerobic ribonucleoside-triphosphate reductase activating protein [Solobacterium sp.]